MQVTLRLFALVLLTACTILPRGSAQRAFLQLSYVSGGDAPLFQAAKVFDGGVAEITSGEVSYFIVLPPDKLEELRAIVNDPRFVRAFRTEDTCCDRANITLLVISNNNEYSFRMLTSNEKPDAASYLDRINAILLSAFGSRWNPPR